MKLPRRQFLHLAAGAAALPAVSAHRRAQAYPTRPVRIIVGFPARRRVRHHRRLIGQWLSERLGQQFVIENRPGAAGNIGTEAAVKAPPDGYSSHFVAPNAFNATLYDEASITISSATLRPSEHCRHVPMACGQSIIPGSKRFPSSSPMPKPIRARSTWPRPATGPGPMWLAELFKMMTGIDIGTRAVSWQ